MDDGTGFHAENIRCYNPVNALTVRLLEDGLTNNPRLHITIRTCSFLLISVALPGFVVRRGKSWKLCHGALTADFRVGCSSGLMTNSFVTNAVPIERAVSC